MTEELLPDPFNPGQPRPRKHDPYNDLVGQLPNSWIVWRDTAFELLKVMPDFNGNVKKVYVYPTKDEQLPAMRIALTSERMSSEGNWMQGEPHFMHTMTMVIAVMIKAGDPAVLDGRVALMAEAIKATLLTDSVFVNTAEGIDQVNTDIIYPPETEVPLCELRIELVGKLQSRWQPLTPNKFNHLHILRELTTTQDDWPALNDDITTMYEGETP